MTSLRNEETEVQKVQCDLSKVTQAVNERVIQKLPFIFIMRFRDVQNAVSLSREKDRCLFFFNSNNSDWACLTIFFPFFFFHLEEMTER